MKRARPSLTLLGPLARATPWTVVVGGSLAGVAVAALLVPLSVWTVDAHLVATRWATVAFAAALAAPLDVDLGPDLDGAGVPRWWRRFHALALVVPVVAVGWWAVLALPAPWMPWRGLTVEAVAVAAVGLGVASLPAVRRRAAPAAVVAALAGACLLLVAQLVPPSLELLASPGSPQGWAAAHRRWAVVLACGAAVICWGWRDPVRRRLRATLATATRRSHRPDPHDHHGGRARTDPDCRLPAHVHDSPSPTIPERSPT